MTGVLNEIAAELRIMAAQAETHAIVPDPRPNRWRSMAAEIVEVREWLANWVITGEWRQGDPDDLPLDPDEAPSVEVYAGWLTVADVPACLYDLLPDEALDPNNNPEAWR